MTFFNHVADSLSAIWDQFSESISAIAHGLVDLVIVLLVIVTYPVVLLVRIHITNKNEAAIQDKLEDAEIEISDLKSDLAWANESYEELAREIKTLKGESDDPEATS